MFNDGGKLPVDFDGWLNTAQKLYDKLTAEGRLVEKAYIDPDAFPEWCRAHAMEMDAQSRIAYANECAAKRFRAEAQ